MKDIENAYLAEQNYINNNLGTTTDLLDLLIPFGYNTLDEYFSDKKDYVLHIQNIQIEHYSVDTVRDAIYNAVELGTSEAFAIDEDATWAFIGSDEFDYNKAEELNVKPLFLGYTGGTIITDNSDFNISLNLPTHIANIVMDSFLDKFNNYFISMGYNTHVDGNDILLENNKKISGSSLLISGESGNFLISIALSDHSDLIEQLCKKQSSKVPGYIAGITKEEIEREVNSWLQYI